MRVSREYYIPLHRFIVSTSPSTLNVATKPMVVSVDDYNSKMECTEQQATDKQHKMNLVAAEAWGKVWKIKEAWEECRKKKPAQAAARRRAVEQVVETAVEWIQMRQIQVSIWISHKIFLESDSMFNSGA